MAFELLHQDETSATAHEGSFCVSHIYSPIAGKDVERLTQLQADLLQRYDRLTLLLVTGETGRRTRIPDEVRHGMQSAMRRFERQLVGVGVVIKSRGLTGVLVSTFFTVFVFASKTKVPMRMFDDVASAVRWLQKLERQDPKIAMDPDLGNAVEQLIQRTRRAPAVAAT